MSCAANISQHPLSKGVERDLYATNRVIVGSMNIAAAAYGPTMMTWRKTVSAGRRTAAELSQLITYGTIRPVY